MGRNIDVIEKAAPELELFTPKVSASGLETRVSGHRGYAELAVKLFAASTSPPRLVAFASVTRGEGVTRTVRGLAAELNRLGKRVTTLDGVLHRMLFHRLGDARTEVLTGAVTLGLPQPAEPENAFDVLTKLRDRYDCVLLDCGALSESMDLMWVAPACDGVVLVVEAGRTGKGQLDRAVKVIREGRSTLLGCVLNKRRYPIPAWLYRLL
jgi:Mrp family chromosome partitioning ATPase